MEKMVYERPVMRAQLFQANASVANCNTVPEAVGEIIKAVFDKVTYWFGTDRISQMNPNVLATQYYYKGYKGEDKTDTHFLEWSVDDNAFYIYEDLDTSGTGVDNWWTGKVENSGKETLQVNGLGSVMGWETSIAGATQFWEADSWWKPDKLVGRISAKDFETEKQFKYTVSGG